MSQHEDSNSGCSTPTRWQRDIRCRSGTATSVPQLPLCQGPAHTPLPESDGYLCRLPHREDLPVPAKQTFWATQELPAVP